MDATQEQEIEELKELVERDLKLNAETNRMVRDMRRSARWGLVFQVFYWLVILGVAGAGYYYVAPYIGQIFGFYQEVQANNNSSHNIVQSMFQTFGHYLQSTTTSQ